MPASVYSRALQKAAELLGGRDQLSRALQVPKAAIDQWIAGEGKPPREVFLRVVDLILDESAPGAGTEPQDSPPPRDAAGSSERYLD